MNSIVVHYKELALKGRNRPWFVKRLVSNLRIALGDVDVRAVRSLMGRVEIELVRHDDSIRAGQQWLEVRDRLRHVFGIANFSRAGRASHDFNALAGALLADLPAAPAASFSV